MKVVSVINYKGGVGKTTVTANLAAELAANGARILLLDLDPQTNLTFSFITPEEWESSYSDSRTIKQSFDSLLRGENFDIRGLVFEPARVKEWLRGRGKLDMICSHLGLINVDLELATLLGGANMRQSKQNFLRVHRRLPTVCRRSWISVTTSSSSIARPTSTSSPKPQSSRASIFWRLPVRIF